ncbi:hypothetical protein HDU91_005314 [Kappamyces sp. JEL0680]|nr:hypothetical protein HDU91_005314 [Kappamyces sp. JEL0680]
MLVVGNNRYVYDISKWITSHPGGQIILHNVNGTDITNDYFHEAGFDASEFTPIAKPHPKKNLGMAEKNSLAGLSRADIISVKRQSLDHDQASLQTVEASLNPQYSEEDWTAIQRSRRTHVHTRLAIQKLAHLVVGELEIRPAFNPRFSISTVTEGSELIPFDPFEYRRYAITHHEVQSSPESTQTFIKLRFCLLYPYDVREGQPRSFLSGQSVEIQVRLSSGERISRYYTPVGGDMNGFEVLVKLKEQGKMSPYLHRQTAGERQFKVRGPFGTPLLKTLGPFVTPYDTIYFFAAGSGITPALQIIQQLYLSVHTKLRVVQDYQATMSDELTLYRGDVVVATHHYLDGWAFGTNVSTGLMGSFPVGAVCPTSPTRFVLFNVSDLSHNIMGADIVEGASLAYPGLFQIERFNSITFTPQRVAMYLESPAESLSIVCGPTGFNSRVSDMLFEFGEGWARSLKILTSDSPYHAE